ncbi:grasp-with-spasm system SPASM domain peptide maturase [Myroides odoratus]|uniref:SPASM domain peptide maturase, grasp-with-spasm system n=1 Tax=Myroides odoratus TaxID=256 RepID=A0A378RLE8_MYROD|nr:grasp-with-spasm system SPASM domain peptide maturase [Myroides odoratus]QQU04739.1 grasp-with-spasm system SPASM domain peptide maturase [Myroides odoratus]STZ27815.1 SPASM domain peptide maturase, grasp-with-spasm system [Myroides odoratus]
MVSNKYLILLPSTFITQGHTNACITDTEKSIYCIVPNFYAEIFNNRNLIDIHKEVASRNILEKNDILAFFDFLVDNHFCIYSNTKIDFIYFNKKSLVQPYELNTIIVDSISYSDLVEKINSIKELNYECIQIRLFCILEYKNLKDIIDMLSTTSLINIELVFNSIPSTLEKEYIQLFNQNIFSKFIIMNYEFEVCLLDNYIYTFQTKLIDEKQCGVISERTFVPTLRNQLLSRNCNSCLYKKISIDKLGYIRNCPSMQFHYGTIKNISVSKVMSLQSFRYYWDLSKDKIQICKDCEYRYICTDCRAYLEDPENCFSKPLKCGYNPYNGKWEEWISNPLKQNAIKFYKLKNSYE